MYILKNAWKSIIRNKGRNILIGIIIVVIGAACAITLSIRNSASTLVKAYEEKYNIEASLTFNRKNLMNNFSGGKDNLESNIEAFNNIDAITVDEINNYGDSKYVDYYYYTYNVGMNSNDITAASEELQKVTTETKTTTKNFGGGMGPGGFPNPSTSRTTTTKTENIINMRGTNGDFTVIGYNSYEGMTDFIEGSYTITSGEVSSDFDSYNCVINEELATLNELSVGDIITLVNPNDTSYEYTLTITGIFSDSSSDSSNMMNMFASSANYIITNSLVVENIVKDDTDISATITPTFVLKDSSVVDKFAKEVEEKGLSENYEVTNNLEEVENETKTVKNILSFSTTFLLVTLIIGGVVLLVINMINVRERKYEIGVLRTIGMSKFKVILEFITEILIIAFFGLIIGTGIGATCSLKVSNTLLANEIKESQEESNKIKENFGGMNNYSNTSETYDSSMSTTIEDDKETKIEQDKASTYGVAKLNELTDINAVVDFKVLLQLLGIGMILVLVSSTSAMISISKFSPLSILKERS